MPFNKLSDIGEKILLEGAKIQKDISGSNGTVEENLKGVTDIKKSINEMIDLDWETIFGSNISNSLIMVLDPLRKERTGLRDFYAQPSNLELLKEAFLAESYGRFVHDVCKEKGKKYVIEEGKLQDVRKAFQNSEYLQYALKKFGPKDVKLDNLRETDVATLLDEKHSFKYSFDQYMMDRCVDKKESVSLAQFEQTRQLFCATIDTKFPDDQNKKKAMQEGAKEFYGAYAEKLDVSLAPLAQSLNQASPRRKAALLRVLKENIERSGAEQDIKPSSLLETPILQDLGGKQDRKTPNIDSLREAMPVKLGFAEFVKHVISWVFSKEYRSALQEFRGREDLKLGDFTAKILNEKGKIAPQQKGM